VRGRTLSCHRCRLLPLPRWSPGVKRRSLECASLSWARDWDSGDAREDLEVTGGPRLADGGRQVTSSWPRRQARRPGLAGAAVRGRRRRGGYGTGEAVRRSQFPGWDGDPRAVLGPLAARGIRSSRARRDPGRSQRTTASDGSNRGRDTRRGGHFQRLPRPLGYRFRERCTQAVTRPQRPRTCPHSPAHARRRRGGGRHGGFISRYGDGTGGAPRSIRPYSQTTRDQPGLDATSTTTSRPSGKLFDL